MLNQETESTTSQPYAKRSDEVELDFFDETQRDPYISAHPKHTKTDDLEEIYMDEEQDETLHLVRHVVPESDTPDLPSLTFRAVLLGSIFTVLGAGMSQLFFYKSNAPSFSTYFVILVTLPLARWMAHVLPDRRVRLFGWNFQLNPGPFSVKEHVLIAVIVSSGATSAYASDIINIQELFFGQHLSAIPAMTLLLTTQTMGFGFAGLVYDLLVRPPSMVFPGALVTVSLFNTLHDIDSILTRQRMRFFLYAFTAIYVRSVADSSDPGIPIYSHDHLPDTEQHRCTLLRTPKPYNSHFKLGLPRLWYLEPEF